MNQRYRDLIAAEFRNCVNNTIHRLEGEATYRPFHSALLSEEALFWSRFERSFSTSFGQRVIEEIAKIVALSNGATSASRQKVTFIQIDAAYDAAIQAHIQGLRDGGRTRRGWTDTMQDILSATPTGQRREIRVISDLWWVKDGVNHYMSCKTVKPNIDQTAIAKEDCIHLTLFDPTCKAYFGLPYNPYGERREDYAFNPPMGIFDFHTDPVVLIGKDMWDTLGGPGCYEEILRIAQAVGVETRQTVQKLIAH